MPAKKIRIVTHNAGFHADDVFGVATLMLLLGEENVEVLRTRDPEVIKTGDYVLDVGFVYDAEKNRFDHHQEGGAGKRENKIPYASFGLVWKKFGKEVCGSQNVADTIERQLVQAVDAYDNGISMHSFFDGVEPFSVSRGVGAFDRATRDVEEKRQFFLNATRWAKEFLSNFIKHLNEQEDMDARVKKFYEQTKDKRLVVIDDEVGFYERYRTSEFLTRFPEPLLFIFKNLDNKWQLSAVLVREGDFEVRKQLPEAWAGKRDEDMASVSGVVDAVFCHNARFTAVAKSKEGALKLAEIALNA